MLQAGDTRGAEREFAGLMKRSPQFFPAEAGFAYARVASQQYRDAIAGFDRVLSRAPSYAPALAGKAEALLGSGQRDLALAAFESALKADPSLADLPPRIEVLRFDKARELVAAGKKAADAGRLEEARRAYTEAFAASPMSGFLARDLGLVELRLGAVEDATRHLRRAVELDASDAAALVGLASALDRAGDLSGAIDALERAYALEPSDTTRAALTRTRERRETAALPAEYRAVARAPRVTRGDLAALVGVRLQPLVAQARQRSGVVATDIRGHWAATWIMSVTRAGIMDVYANHTFQPGAAIRRIDLAQVVSRILSASNVPQPSPRSRVPIADMSPDHLGYPAASVAVSSGVLALNEGRFLPSVAVTGAEAVDAVARLERLVLKR
jgi:tetratricopeptide (TPR) repeat protein